LEWLGEERLSVMGYSQEALLSELQGAPNSFRDSFLDLPYVWRDLVANYYELDARRLRKSGQRFNHCQYTWG
jgi:hypothetical protein